MLLSEHVLARRQGGTLVLRTLDATARARAEAIAREILVVIKSHVGASRSELEEALEAVEALPKDVKIKGGLVKLAIDRCVFESTQPLDAIALRAELFARAADERRTSGRVDRAALLASFAHDRDLDSATIEHALYADLKASHTLVSLESVPPVALVTAFITGQAQAVVLRAERVVARVACTSPGAVRALFRALKFHRLLFTALRDGDAYVLGIDGPMSLFDSGTKYGPRLAMVLPALEEAGPVELEAVIRWGKDRERLVFKWSTEASHAAAKESPLPDEVEELRTALARGGHGLAVRRSDAILVLPGIGTCVPDLELKNEEGRVVYVEVLGFWSREAVWKRIELAEKGLGARVVYCVSARLRVSEEALPASLPAALYVYKGTMRPRAVVERAQALLAR